MLSCRPRLRISLSDSKIYNRLRLRSGPMLRSNQTTRYIRMCDEGPDFQAMGYAIIIIIT